MVDIATDTAHEFGFHVIPRRRVRDQQFFRSLPYEPTQWLLEGFVDGHGGDLFVFLGRNRSEFSVEYSPGSRDVPLTPKGQQLIKTLEERLRRSFPEYTITTHPRQGDS